MAQGSLISRKGEDTLPAFPDETTLGGLSDSALPIPEMFPDSMLDMENIVIEGDGTLSAAADDLEAEQEQNFDENLAESMEDADLNRLANDLCNMLDADRESQNQWKDRLQRGYETMGLISRSNDDLPFDGAANITHPMITEAAVQFNARASAEILPPTGPCKGQVMGEATDEKREQAERVENHMNFQMTEEDEGYYDEYDQLLFMLPTQGSAFTKTYFDNQMQTTTTRFVKVQNCLVPYTATSLQNSPRYSVWEMVEYNQIVMKMSQGLYRETPIERSEGDLLEGDMISSRELDDEVDARVVATDQDDSVFEIHEMNIEYDLPGHESEDGVALPYLITLNKTTEQIYAIRRNWRPDDEQRRRRHYVVHHKYLPGPGFYGLGLLHILGGLADAASGSIRALLDSASFATLQGGFKAKETGIRGGELRIRMGEWQDVDLTADELRNAFYTPPFKEPSRALFEILKVLEESARRFAGTTEAVVGDAATSGPVGTTVALIEQSTKVMTGVHKRLHRAQRREFAIRAELNAEYLPEGEIYYDTVGGRNYVTSDDYLNRNVDVIPVSDPNITSASQRISQSQALLEMKQTDPDLYHRKRVKIHLRMLKDLGIDNGEDYIDDPDQKHYCDAIGEGSKLVAGMGIHAFPEQNHEQHMMIHQAQIEHYKTLPQEQAQPLIVEMMDHLAKHEGYRMYMAMQMLTGLNLPPLDLYDDDPESDMSPEIEAQVTAAGAQFTQQLMQEIQANQPPPPEDMETKAKIERETAEHDQKLRQDEERHQQEIRQKEEEFQAREARQQADRNPDSADEKIMRQISGMKETLSMVVGLVTNMAGVMAQNGMTVQKEGSPDASNPDNSSPNT